MNEDEKALRGQLSGIESAQKDLSKGNIVYIVFKENITDLLPHLAAEQREKSSDKFIEGEKLDLLVGNRPVKGEEKFGFSCAGTCI